MGNVTALNNPVPGYYERAEALGNEITELCSYLYAGEYQLLAKIREFDENGYWGGPGLVSCAHWLNWKFGIGITAAREKIRVAKALKGLPLISEAFRKGEISFDEAVVKSTMSAKTTETSL